MGGGQDKPAWTDCPPGVKITNVGGKISRDCPGGKINCYTGTGGQKVKKKFFQNIITMHIKQKGITKTATWSQIFCLQPPPPPPLTLRWVEKQNLSLSEQSYVADQIKRNHKCSNMVAIISPAVPHRPMRGLTFKGQSSTFSEHGYVAYQI